MRTNKYHIVMKSFTTQIDMHRMLRLVKDL